MPVTTMWPVLTSFSSAASMTIWSLPRQSAAFENGSKPALWTVTVCAPMLTRIGLARGVLPAGLSSIDTAASASALFTSMVPVSSESSSTARFTSADSAGLSVLPNLSRSAAYVS
jgi:hypothetical protein